MIDYWLIFNLMVPFIEVILHINKDLKEKQEESQNKNDNSTVYPEVIKVNSEDGNIHEVVSISKGVGKTKMRKSCGWMTSGILIPLITLTFIFVYANRNFVVLC